MTKRPLVLLPVLLSLALPAGPATAAAQDRDGFVPGEVLVKFRTGASAASRRASVARRGQAVISDLEVPGWTRVKVGAGQTVAESVASYRNDPAVAYAQPNFVYRTARAPDDPYYGQMWSLQNTGQQVTTQFTRPPGTPLRYDVAFPGSNPGTPGADIGAEAAWNAITDCSGVVVAVVDTGIDYLHEDLAANMWTVPAFPLHGYDFVDDDGDPMDVDGHGSHVAGTIGAVGNDGRGVTGVCWKASLMAVRVADGSGSTTARILAGVYFALAHGAKVINMSLTTHAGFDQAYSDAITMAEASDVVVVVAAGNDAADNDVVDAWPCNFTQPNLVCVAALDQQYGLAGFSNHGLRTVRIGAPGTNALSTGYESPTQYLISDGTSMASPVVAGVAAMVRAYNPRYGFADVVEALVAGGRDVPSLAGKTITGRAVNAIGAIGHVQAPTGLVAREQDP